MNIVFNDKNQSPPASKTLPHISFELRNVSLLDAFHLCLHLTGLSYRITDAGIEIFAPPAPSMG